MGGGTGAGGQSSSASSSKPNSCTPLSTYDERKQQTPKELNSNGEKCWSGVRGESLCYTYNSDAQKVLRKHGLKGIQYNNCIPDFSPVSRGTVEIRMSTDRLGSNGNFNQADIALAKIKGCSPRDVANWRRINGYTWHECNDMKTCQKIPSCINSSFGHLGGVAECNRAKWEDQFDAI